MGSFPAWLSLIGIAFTIAAGLAAAVAVYKVNLANVTVEEQRKAHEKDIARVRATNEDLRGEIADYERRETALEARIAVMTNEQENCRSRIAVMEDLLRTRADDAELRQGVADLKKTVDGEFRDTLKRIEAVLRTVIQDGGYSDA